MKRMLYSVELKSNQHVPFLLADVDQEHVQNFKDLFLIPYKQDKLTFEYCTLRFNGDLIKLHTFKDKPFIPEFSLSIGLDDVLNLNRQQINISGRYALFAGMEYYPSGGFNDLIHMHDNLVILRDLLKNGLYAAKVETDWYHIVDMISGEMIERHHR